MAYNIMAVAVTAVLFLAVVIAPQWTETKKPPRPSDTSDTSGTSGRDRRTMCPLSIPGIVQNCYATLNAFPSKECCKDLKTASKREVTCLCNNVIAHPDPLYTNTNQVNKACGVLDKYACDVAPTFTIVYTNYDMIIIAVIQDP
ncbi:unnamed protein product [Arabidopsis thaliana]|uniref:(thale cress) hypothetical protein n=1 Tax=Arabidopsis thaliana TaxID=3702 RepID=A0A7G2F580_ARATH|nr:unnamed protein product [Arabidopsis thaliana]